MPVEMHVVQSNDDYRDVDVYVTLPSGEEWLLRIYKEVETGNIVDPESARYAPSKEEPFSDDYRQAPPEVMAAFTEARPRALELLAGQ